MIKSALLTLFVVILVGAIAFGTAQAYFGSKNEAARIDVEAQVLLSTPTAYQKYRQELIGAGNLTVSGTHTQTDGSQDVAIVLGTLVFCVLGIAALLVVALLLGNGGTLLKHGASLTRAVKKKKPTSRQAAAPQPAERLPAIPAAPYYTVEEEQPRLPANTSTREF